MLKVHDSCLLAINWLFFFVFVCLYLLLFICSWKIGLFALVFLIPLLIFFIVFVVLRSQNHTRLAADRVLEFFFISFFPFGLLLSALLFLMGTLMVLICFGTQLGVWTTTAEMVCKKNKTIFSLSSPVVQPYWFFSLSSSFFFFLVSLVSVFFVSFVHHSPISQTLSSVLSSLCPALQSLLFILPIPPMAWPLDFSHCSVVCC